MRLMEHLIGLHQSLTAKQYQHGPYEAFMIADPKPRHIHKACVRDRVLHHAVYRVLYPFFDRTFVAGSYSCREDKGTHLALRRFATLGRRVGRNTTRTCWVLKCDIKKFFASIDQNILLYILSLYIPDPDVRWLLGRIIGSFNSTAPGPTSPRLRGGAKGLPLGNLTSQLLVNIYMNEFDQYVKHQLKARYYIRYADDFVFLSEDRSWLEALVPKVDDFLTEVLQLSLHPNKVFIRTLASGVDFLGWVHFEDHRVPRTATVRRMRRRLRDHSTEEARQSYLGLLSHGNAYELQQSVLNLYSSEE